MIRIARVLSVAACLSVAAICDQSATAELRPIAEQEQQAEPETITGVNTRLRSPQYARIADETTWTQTWLAHVERLRHRHEVLCQRSLTSVRLAYHTTRHILTGLRPVTGPRRAHLSTAAGPRLLVTVAWTSSSLSPVGTTTLEATSCYRLPGA